MELHLAQVNVSTLLAPLDHPSIDEFRNSLGAVNATADDADGFVWRLQTEDGNATAIQAFPDPLTIVNLSVWRSPESLRAFVSAGRHRELLHHRSMWFERGQRRVALWWIPAAEQPTVADAKSRLAFLARVGESPYAFGLSREYPRLTITPTDLSRPETLMLISELNTELESMYPEPGSTHFHLAPDQVVPGTGALLIAHSKGAPIGCGAYRKIDPRTAEVKRMYVREVGRGQKIGAALLADLEHRARGDGVERMVLEAGERQDAALALYTTSGYTRCSPWGEYIESPQSRCYEKPLEPV